MAITSAVATLGLSRAATATAATTSRTTIRLQASLLVGTRLTSASTAPPSASRPAHIRFLSSSTTPPPQQPSIASSSNPSQGGTDRPLAAASPNPPTPPPPQPTGHSGPDSDPTPRGRLERLWSSRAFKTAILVVQLAALFHLIIEHIGEVRICVGPSMIPTVAPAGDVLFHVRLPALQVWNRLFGSSPSSREGTDSPSAASRGYKWSHSKFDRTFGLPLQVGDLVTAFSPKDPKRQVCKRIIGLPGDTVLVDPRHPYGPGAELSEASSLPFDLDLAPASHPLAPHAQHEQEEDEQARLKPHYVTVPTGHVWLSGDNLANSIDSRRYGPVPMGCIKGKVIAKVSRGGLGIDICRFGLDEKQTLTT